MRDNGHITEEQAVLFRAVWDAKRTYTADQLPQAVRAARRRCKATNGPADAATGGLTETSLTEAAFVEPDDGILDMWTSGEELATYFDDAEAGDGAGDVMRDGGGGDAEGSGAGDAEGSGAREFDLTEDQLIDRITAPGARNVVIEGEPGAGKSSLLRRIRDAIAGRCGGQKKVVLVAVRAIVATLNNGSTLAYAMDMECMAPGRERDMHPDARERLRAAEYLLFDEYEEAGRDMLKQIDRLCRMARDRHDEPFGGLIVVFAGNVLQMPPIVQRIDRVDAGGRVKVVGSHRFDDDGLALIQRAYQGRCTPADVQNLLGNKKEVTDADLKRCVVLVATKTSASILHNEFYVDDNSAQKGEARVYGSATTRCQPEPTTQSKEFVVEAGMALWPEIKLREDTKVLIVANQMGGRILNGMTGRVRSFVRSSEQAERIALLREFWRERDIVPEMLDAYKKVSPNLEWPEIEVYLPSGETTSFRARPRIGEVYARSGQLVMRRIALGVVGGYAIKFGQALGSTLPEVIADLDGSKREGTEAFLALTRVRNPLTDIFWSQSTVIGPNMFFVGEDVYRYFTAGDWLRMKIAPRANHAAFQPL
ncbi:hypothetical protein WJX72_001291 [[Myrmecia] bisecta]|uniref:ATP-dependent DNA helicase n=1 Tax=[Myrmecia] bisecta TaxID=41462 RepID=A0AAW1PWI5_9CHLO